MKRYHKLNKLEMEKEKEKEKDKRQKNQVHLIDTHDDMADNVSHR